MRGLHLANRGTSGVAPRPNAKGYHIVEGVVCHSKIDLSTSSLGHFRDSGRSVPISRLLDATVDSSYDGISRRKHYSSPQFGGLS